MDLDLFTAAMRNEFVTGYEATAATAPIEDCIGTINSTARIENYAFLTPTPGMAQYLGRRRLGNIGMVKYQKENLEFDASIQVLTRDIKDDQIGGYPLKFRELSEKSAKYPNILAMQTLNLGATTACFDGSYLFADSHTIGTGDNKMSDTGTGNSDGLAYKVIFLVKNRPIKPLLWQQRMAPVLNDSTQGWESSFHKEVRYWVDMEGNVGYGYWWDAIQFTWTNMPTQTQLLTMMGDMQNQMRGFKLPKAFADDTSEFPHAQLDFTDSSVSVVCSTGLAALMRIILGSDTLVQSGAAVTNPYKGNGKLVISPYLNDSSLL